MIVSHAHRFVFVRPRKVASSSMAKALLPHTKSGDLIVVPDGVKTKDQNGQLTNSEVNRRKHIWTLRPHSPLNRLVRFVGPEVLDYRVVTLARNPWDRAVSEYFWVRSKGAASELSVEQQKTDFDNFLKRRSKVSRPRMFLDRLEGRRRVSKFGQAELCMLEGKFAADFVVFFEDLNSSVEQLSRFLDLDIQLPKKREKGDIRASNTREWQSLYSDEGIQIVKDACAEDIDLFGYTFNGQQMPSYLQQKVA